MHRRHFLSATTAAALATTMAQLTPTTRAAEAAETNEWGDAILDIHFHLRPGLDANMTHMQGCGVTNAVLLARASAATTEQIKAMQAKYPKRFAWSASADITKPEAADSLTKAVKDGAQGLGEIKFHVAADGPELQRMYALAGELGVPILVHFQEVPHFEGEGVFSTGFKQFAAMLKKYPKTKFIGHADAFWANVSADYAEQESYPAGPIKRGGITDKLLGDYANLYGDLSANSGNNALSRDAEFTKDFLQRHQNKLVFGSDCSCQDGHGGGVSQNNNPAAARLRGKCVARETLTLLKQHTKPAVFRKLTWTNGHKLFQIKA